MGLFSALRSISIFIKISKNKVEIVNLDNGEFMSEQATEPFSTDRFIIADFNKTNLVVKSVMTNLFPKKSWLPQSFNILIQQTVPVEGGLSPIELRALQDLAELTSYGPRIKVLDHFDKVTNEEAMKLLSGKRTTNKYS